VQSVLGLFTLTSLRTSLSLLLLGLPALGLSVACGLIDQSDLAGTGGSTGTGAYPGYVGGTSTGAYPGYVGVTPTGGSNGTGAYPGFVGVTGGSNGTGAYPGFMDPNGCTDDPALLECPDFCTAKALASCEAPSEFEKFYFDVGCKIGAVVITFANADVFKTCYYVAGALAGGRISSPAVDACWGIDPDTCPAPTLESCNGFGGAPGTSDVPQCFSFPSSCGPCCPDEPVDCTEPANEGLSCANGACGCSCDEGQFVCAC
jgi:hypothetical protein